MDYSKNLFSEEKDAASKETMKKAFAQPQYQPAEQPNANQNLLNHLELPKGSGKKTHMSVTISANTKNKLQALAKKQGYNSVSAFVNDLLTQLVQD
ncbi:hypothetical protein [Fructobacillus tropaeoli]|uniref:hypothetical protein n=1 Tax=Fructobacillus tropaeoli TaxID=709323 RepID=UPI002D8E0B1F|nr:unnamed protein product [Fructobacillus tropaeoli]